MTFFRRLLRDRTRSYLEEYEVRDKGLENSISNFLKPARTAVLYIDYEIHENYCSVDCWKSMRGIKCIEKCEGSDIDQSGRSPGVQICSSHVLWRTRYEMEMSTGKSLDQSS